MTDGMTANGSQKRLILGDGVQVYYNGTDELRLRKGVWNFEEGVLSFDGLSEDHKESLVALFALLQDGGVDPGRLPNEQNLTALEREQVAETLDALRANDFVSDGEDVDGRRLLNQLLSGADDYLTDRSAGAGPILFFADSQSIKDYAVTMATEIDLPMTVLTQADFKRIEALDLTTKFDAYGTRQQLESARHMIEPFGSIVGCLERPHIVFLRNLNRVLVQTSQTLSLSLLDGPFTTVFTIKPPETGCFECFEQRLLARMEEKAVYQEYVQQTRGLARSQTKVHASPLMHSLAAQALFEGLLVHRIGKAKLAGRVLNTYVPLLEIQVQPLLRVPFCPACGFVAQARMEEMYSSSKKIIDRVVDRIALVDD
ncbi:TOMM precursor leader peptide-binding protein [Actinoplanes sp. NPDC049265]|uniref:TOMM precursor leader peptide-binding protein n=1 Tax=Actinoplanes sp. NPDC049265 TaxID=3363902 RepID=UPI00371D1FB1